MPPLLHDFCRCHAVAFTVESHTPAPYQLCYYGICRKTAGGGGYAINIMGTHASLDVTGRDAVDIYRADLAEADGSCRVSTGQRHFCKHRATALWLWDESRPALMHPLPRRSTPTCPCQPERTHPMLRFKPSWVVPRIKAGDSAFDLYPDASIQDLHRTRGLRVA